MSAMDKLYGTKIQWYTLYGFVQKNKVSLKETIGYDSLSFGTCPDGDDDSYFVDKTENNYVILYCNDKAVLWLLRNCPFTFIINELLLNYCLILDKDELTKEELIEELSKE